MRNSRVRKDKGRETAGSERTKDAKQSRVRKEGRKDKGHETAGSGREEGRKDAKQPDQEGRRTRNSRVRKDEGRETAGSGRTEGRKTRNRAGPGRTEGRETAGSGRTKDAIQSSARKD